MKSVPIVREQKKNVVASNGEGLDNENLKIFLEFNELTKIKHPNILKFIEMFEEPTTRNYFCIVMEFAKDEFLMVEISENV